ncbi:MAG: VCBS repeat-containing protein [Rubrivivax sp.]
MAIGDVDGDGHADALLATGFNHGSADDFTLFVFRSDGRGGFAAPQRYATHAGYGGEIGSTVVADLDGQGRNAVIVGAAGVGIEIFRRQPDGTLASSQFIDTPASYVVRVADMDGDGRPDLVGRPFYGNAVKVWLQGPDGQFGPGTDVPVDAGSFGDMAVGDVDGDGRPDIVVAGGIYSGQSVGVVVRTAGGGYASPVYPDLSPFGDAYGVTVGDVNGDGRADIVLALQFGSRIVVLAQTAQGGLAPPVGVQAASNADHAAVVDIDGDGRPDVVSWSWGGYPVSLNRQRSDGTLGGTEQWPVFDYGTWTPSQLAVGDLDGDGRPDILYASAWLRQRAVPAPPPPAPTSAGPRRPALQMIRLRPSM